MNKEEKENTDIEKKNQSIEERAINEKEKKSDGREINQQVKKRKEHHQPRDTA